MGEVIIDDVLYVSAQEFLSAHDRAGLGEVFPEWVRGKVDPNLTPARLGVLDGMLRALMTYSDGDYPPSPSTDDKTVVWTFFRAWVDRYGWTVSMPADS